MKDCYLCTRPIIWSNKKTINGCKKHYFHSSCCQSETLLGRCPICLEDEVNFFLHQNTLSGARSAYKKYFDAENILKKTLSLDNDFLFKYLVKKINTHTFLLQCAVNNDIPMFEHVVKHSSLNLFSTHNGKTLLEDLENKDAVFKQIILKKAKVHQDVDPPIRPIRQKRVAPPPPPSVSITQKQHLEEKRHQPTAPPLFDQPSSPPSYEEAVEQSSLVPLGESNFIPSATVKDGYKNIYPNLSVFISLNGEWQNGLTAI